MRIRHQFLITLLSASMVILLIMLVALQFSFHRSLDQYLGQRQQAVLADLSIEFADYYANYGSFDGITLRTLIWNLEDKNEQRIPRDLVLMDSDHFPIFGPPVAEEELALHSINVDGDTVGWLGLPNSPEFRESIEKRFEQRQRRTVISVGIAVLLLALFGAWWLSRKLVRPIESVARFSAQLSAGEYQQRLPTKRQDELGELIHSMNSLAHALASGKTSRQRWLADLSHELRTPVTVLQGELEAMQDGIRPMNTQQIDALYQQVAHLGKLLNDLHDLSLADAGALRYKMTNVDINQLLIQRCNAFRTAFDNAHQKLIYYPSNAPLFVHGDAVRLSQLVDNLLSNSQKYTHQGGEISLRCSIGANEIRIELEDSAPGVSNEQLPKLFNYLYRADVSRNRDNGGAGLGLAICQRIVEAHQGTINASHSARGGICITVTLPHTQSE